jgi:hypothetical protein
MDRKTKKNISNNLPHPPKLTKNKVKDKNKKLIAPSQNDLIESLLSKGSKTTIPNNSIKKIETPTKQSLRNRLSQSQQKRTKSKKDRMINNFHQAINSTKSDQIIVKMLELNETDIINFYSNLEKMIGKDLSLEIRNNMSNDIKQNQKVSGANMAICPFCHENKSNCVILLCGHLICHKCGKNINRCKYPCPKCKKPIKYIQYIVD